MESLVEISNLQVRIDKIKQGMVEAGMEENAQPEYEGLIYAIALCPKGRFKIGWTKGQDALARLGEAKRWVPEAELIAQWPARQGWEKIVRYVIASDLPVNVALGGYATSNSEQNYAGMEVIYNSKEEVVKSRGEEIIQILSQLPQQEGQ